MEFIRGYYSLIQYCPDESRLEAINIGVVLFCPEVHFLKARFSDSIRSKVTRAFGKQNWHLFDSQKDAIRHRLSDPNSFDSQEAFAKFAAIRANSIQISAPRFMKTESPADAVDRLFDGLVGESKPAERAPRVNLKLTKVLETKGLLPMVQRNVEISIPKLGRTMKVNCGYQNGRFNLLQAEQFGLSDGDQIIQKASRLAVEGRFLYDESDPALGPLRLVVIGQFKDEQEAVRGQVREIFKKNDVGLYTFDHIDPLLDDIRMNGEKYRSPYLLSS